jgi:uncharacterized protein
VLGTSCALADAAATAIANHVQGPEDIEAATRRGQSIPGILGVLVIAGEKMGLWGQIEITAIAGSADGGR